jgi:hypothetical protein
MLIRPMAGCQLLCLHVGSAAPAGEKSLCDIGDEFYGASFGPQRNNIYMQMRAGNLIEQKLNCKCTKWTQRTGLLAVALVSAQNGASSQVPMTTNQSHLQRHPLSRRVRDKIRLDAL